MPIDENSPYVFIMSNSRITGIKDIHGPFINQLWVLDILPSLTYGVLWSIEDDVSRVKTKVGGNILGILSKSCIRVQFLGGMIGMGLMRHIVQGFHKKLETQGVLD